MGKKSDGTWSKGSYQMGVRLSDTLKKKLAERCKAEGTSMAAFVRRLITREVTKPDTTQ